MNPIEEAAEAFVNMAGYSPEDGDAEYMREALLVWVRAAVGCPTCKGTRVWKNDADMVHEKCPKEHVKLTVYGETIYADPTKCEWRCTTNRARPCSEDGKAATASEHNRSWLSDKEYAWYRKTHAPCGWQPRMDVLLGGE